MVTDTMDIQCESLHGDKQFLFYGNHHMFVADYPTPSGLSTNIEYTLKDFIQKYGTPQVMIMDVSKSQTDRVSTFMSRLIKNKIIPMIYNSYRPNQNPVKQSLGNLSKDGLFL